MNKLLNKNHIILLLIFIVSLMKFGLIGKGYLAFVDERRYLESFKAVESISHGNLEQTIVHIFGTQGRPGDAILKMIPATGQYLSSYITGNALHETENAFPLFIFNYIVFSLILLVHYKFSKLLLKDTFLSLFSVLILSSLVVSYISLRHADPYDESLLILYFVLYKMLKRLIENNISKKMFFTYGFLTFFGYLCYPGYILFYGIIVGMLVLYGLKKSMIRTKFIHGFWFGTGSFTCLTLFEIISRIVGESFLVSSYFLSINIKQGSFEECFSFIFKYLFEVEQLNGIILIAGLLLFICGIFIFGKNEIKKNPAVYLLFGISFLIFLSYASFGYFFEAVVFYARLTKQFIPLLIVFSVFAIQQLMHRFEKSQKFWNVAMIIVSFGFLFQFNSTLNDYKNTYYPKDVAWEYYTYYHFKTYDHICEYNQSWTEMPNFSTSKNTSSFTNQKLIFVNICGIYPFDEKIVHNPFIPDKNQKLLFSGKNCVAFKAYQFEGYSIESRNRIDTSATEIKVYKE